LAYTTLALYFLLFTGKAFYLPLTLTVASTSNSIISQWDLIVGLADYILKPSNGTYVLVCLREAWSTPCSIGIYIANNNSRGVILTANGNNGRLLLNNFNNMRVYSIRAIIPSVKWISLLTLYFTLIIAGLVKSVKAGYKLTLRDSSVLSIATLLILSINSILVGAVYIDQATSRYSIPGVNIKWNFNLENSTLILTLDLSKTYTLEGVTCIHTLQVDNASYNYLEAKITNNTVLVVIPDYIYEYLYNKTILEPIPLIPANLSVYSAIPVFCEFKLDKGVFQVTLIIEFYWRDLVITVENALVRIYNPNPVSLDIKIYTVNVERGQIVNSTSISLKSLSDTVLDLSTYGAGKYRVLVQYTLLGLGRSKVVYAEFS